MTMAIPTMTQILEARQLIRRYLPRTPLYEYPALSSWLGCTAYVKHENYQPVGAFKVRGGINLMARLSDEERRRGVITASTGNHGQSIAYAARLFGVRAIVAMPERANPDKVAAMQHMGAEVIFHGKDFDEAREYVEKLAIEQGYRYIHSANEPHLIAGVGTIGLEILEDAPDVDAIIVPVGGGSNAAGISLVVKALNPQTAVIGVQSEAAPAVYLSWKSGSPQRTEFMNTFAEGLATRQGFALTVDILVRNLSDFVLVSDEEIRQAVVQMLSLTHSLAEPAGAAPLAAACQLKSALRGRKVALVLSGANITVASLRELLR
ncbi:MAG: threonine/serine dehydratase [Acidobacteriota bacterium]|nr:threonine/serine dehydratase [Blastocatellia bacterium]MDW8240304.1 threonine/serine dehydratase [Acidobacteriota bacterium]